MTTSKAELRTEVLAKRRGMPPQERAKANAALADAVLELLSGVTVVAAYTPMRTEPGGDALLPAVAGRRVLLPVLLADNDLNWASDDGSTWGPAGIAEAELVLVPAVAVDRRGVRLGRGGGSYDRALARARPGVPIIALLFDGEFIDSAPAEPHDQRVSGVITPRQGLVTLPLSG